MQVPCRFWRSVRFSADEHPGQYLWPGSSGLWHHRDNDCCRHTEIMRDRLRGSFPVSADCWPWIFPHCSGWFLPSGGRWCSVYSWQVLRCSPARSESQGRDSDCLPEDSKFRSACSLLISRLPVCHWSGWHHWHRSSNRWSRFHRQPEQPRTDPAPAICLIIIS